MSASRVIPVVKGFRDVSPEECARWLRFEREAAEHFGRYGFTPVRLPVVERVELFQRSLGDTSDVVEKEMFAFDDRDGTTVTLRPEATASTVRAYLAAGPGAQGGAARYWYAGPMFRRERPQRGRFRQFHQIGVEVFADAGPAVDAEILIMLADYLAACGVPSSTLLLGSLGDEACRPAYRERLRTYAAARASELCETCGARLERNPMRLLDCKSESCRAVMSEAPLLVDHLCEPCASHFGTVRALLDAEGVAYELAPRLVRGLDYYTRTAFEVVAEGLGAQDAIGGGGRYDGLVAALGGPNVPAFGFALGVDRMAIVTDDAVRAPGPLAVVLALGDAALAPSVALATRLRRAGHAVLVEPPGRSVKAMLRTADRHRARLAILIGEDELRAGHVTVRHLTARRDHPSAFALDVDATDFGRWMIEHDTEKGDA
jgi:histidyl-tRNA synthetase